MAGCELRAPPIENIAGYQADDPRRTGSR
jgi:hypothetical protein